MDIADAHAIQSHNQKEWRLIYEDRVWFRIVDPISNKCLAPKSGERLDDRDQVVLQNISDGTHWQLWQYAPVDKQANWQYIVNKCERLKGHIRKMCIDVQDERTLPGTKIIVYHVKTIDVNCPDNQWWQDKLSMA